MFFQHREPFSLRSDEGFGRPVESIMRCEDFKSNFARKLSNRYISKPPLTSLKIDAPLRFCPSDGNSEKTAENGQERIVPHYKVLKCGGQQNSEVVKTPEKPLPDNSDKRRIEVTALTMEVETLKWQLAQTEANRQMHIALLKQIVTFLNRVKEKIECKEESANRRDRSLGKILPNSFSSADLPRSRSVVHVNNKNLEYLSSCTKKVNSRNISKSITNVNGFKEFNSSWNHSKLSLTSETENAKKISEEMSRLITLANTVLSMKLPDLANGCDKQINEAKLPKKPEKEIRRKYESTMSLNRIEEDTVNNFMYNNNGQTTVTGIDPHELKNDGSNNNFNLTPPANLGLNDELVRVDLNEERYNVSPTNNQIEIKNKKTDYSRPANFIEDESGFSSMSSFQEIGIPIISIIPPSPCKSFDEEISDSMEEKETWKTESLELDKQPVKVFWV